ncbi:MAG: Uma2 family endonuclease [Planctomycetota bacterium]
MSTEAKSKTKLTYKEYCCYPDDGRRHEIIDGVHYVNPAPSTYHQHVSKRLQYQLYTQFELAGIGILYNAPVDVHLTDHDIVQPDLVVILNARKHIVTPTKVKGAPDLLVEILSPSSIDNDRHLKRSLYERCGIREYWIVDPFEQKLEQLVLTAGRYELQPESEIVRPTIAEGVAIPLSEVW